MSGFTLIELMIVIAIAGVLLAIALPSFQTTIKNNRMVAGANETVGAFNYARMQAVSRGDTVYIKPFTGTDWTSGFTVWADNNDAGNTAGTYDTGEELRFWEAMGDGLAFTGAANKYEFSASGGLNNHEEIDICDSSRTGETGRAITLLASGMIAVDDKTNCG